MAQSFDARAGRITGEPKALAGPIKYHNGNDAAFDVSDNGVLIYRLDEGLAVHTARVDRSARAGTPDDRGCRLLQTAAVLAGHGTRGRRAIGAGVGRLEHLDLRHHPSQRVAADQQWHRRSGRPGRLMASGFCTRRSAVRTTTSTKRRRTDRATSVWSSIRRKTSWSRTGRSMVVSLPSRSLAADSGSTTSRRDRTSRSGPRRRQARCRPSSRPTRSSSRTRWTAPAGRRCSWSRCRSPAHSGKSPPAGAPSPTGEATAASCCTCRWMAG